MAWSVEAQVPFWTGAPWRQLPSFDTKQNMCVDTAGQKRTEKCMFNLPADEATGQPTFVAPERAVQRRVGYSWVDATEARAKAMVTDQPMQMAEHCSQ